MCPINTTVDLDPRPLGGVRLRRSGRTTTVIVGGGLLPGVPYDQFLGPGTKDLI